MGHHKLSVLGIAGILAALAAAQAQEQKMEVPKPGPAHERLEFFVGNWQTEAEVKPGPGGAGGKATAAERCSWMEGGEFFVLCHGEATGPMGKLYSFGVMGYDTAAKTYTQTWYHHDGASANQVGSVNGKTWVFTSESTVGGRPRKRRTTFVETSPSSYTFKHESSQDGEAWVTGVEGTVTKK